MIPIAMVPLRLSTLLSNCQSEKWHVHIWFRARHVNNLMLIDLHQSILMVEKQKWGGGAGGGGPIYLERSTSRFNGWRPVRSPKRFFFSYFFFFCYWLLQSSLSSRRHPRRTISLRHCNPTPSKYSAQKGNLPLPCVFVGPSSTSPSVSQDFHCVRWTIII